jgi:mono/diheme cytochrome c family protein
MRHVAVRRVTLVLGAGFVVYAAAFAWLVRDEPVPAPTPEQSAPAQESTAEGRLLFERHCATCHTVEGLAPGIREGGPNGRGAAETFLQDHGDSTDEGDRLILDYLSGADAR